MMDFGMEHSKIKRILVFSEKKQALQREQKELFTPDMTDMCLIGRLYDIFKDVLSERDCPPNPQSVIQRKKFLFIILYLYSPETLAGGVMKRGLRKVLGDVLGLSSLTIISDNISDLVFLSQRYSDWHADVMAIYSEMMARITP